MSGAYLPVATHASLTEQYYRELGNDVFTTVDAETVKTAKIEPQTSGVVEIDASNTKVEFGADDAVSGLTISWNTVTAGQGNAEFMVGKGTGVGNIDFYAGLTDGANPTPGSQGLRVTANGIETPQLTLAGAVFTNPRPRFFNWSASNPGGSMTLPALGTLDVTQNFTLNSANLYRVTFEVYIVQTTPGTGEVAIYTDTSPIVYFDVIPTTAIIPALDFRKSYCGIVNPSDSTLKIIINNTSNQQVNLTWQPILLEDLGPQPTAPTG